MLESLVDADDGDLLRIDEVLNYLVVTKNQNVDALLGQPPHLLQPYAPYLWVT